MLEVFPGVDQTRAYNVMASSVEKSLMAEAVMESDSILQKGSILNLSEGIVSEIVDYAKKDLHSIAKQAYETGSAKDNNENLVVSELDYTGDNIRVKDTWKTNLTEKNL